MTIAPFRTPARFLRLLNIAIAAASSVMLSAIAADEIDWNRARTLFQKDQRGEALSVEERSYLEHAKEVRRKEQGSRGAAAPDAGIDMQRARELFERKQRGEQLSAEERDYLEKAMARRQQGAQRGANVPAPRGETGMVPITDLTETYKDQDGGLYGEGRNEPPSMHAQAAKTETERIQPLDGVGKPSLDGKIVLLSIGMSNTTQEFSKFVQMANADADRAPNVVLVDGAQGGQTAERIADEGAQFWTIIDQRLKAAGVTPQQVQVIWFKEANAGPSAGFPAEMQKLKTSVATDLQVAKKRFPNTRIAYLSSRIYAGYAASPLNPEPYAYESAFAVRWVIQDQMKGSANLNYNPDRGEVKAPLLLWGPYLWADGVKGRKAGDLVWTREDFAGDGTHPSESGRKKVAEQLLKFFKNDSNTRTWFMKK